jgi:hypothetical protein
MRDHANRLARLTGDLKARTHQAGKLQLNFRLSAYRVIEPCGNGFGESEPQTNNPRHRTLGFHRYEAMPALRDVLRNLVDSAPVHAARRHGSG